MGIVFGRFHKKKTALEKLEKLDEDIKSIEKFRLTTEQAQKKIVGQFILVSAGVYILVATVFYFYYFPATFYDQVFYITPLLLVPFIIVLVKRLLTWYYNKKISQNETKLTVLRTEKKQLLDQVMDTETYKVAKTILEKFAPDQLRKSPGNELVQLKNLPQTPNLRLRTNLPYKDPIVSITKTPITPIVPPKIISASIQSVVNTNGQNALSVRNPPGARTQIPMVREVLPRDRSVLDKMVEYLVGDGPSNRFALICKNCQSHNGMALKEEFEYMSFRCCYCFSFNPARKLKPSAPKLEFDINKTPKQLADSSSDSEEKSTSESEKKSASDSEEENSVSDNTKNLKTEIKKIIEEEKK